MARGDKNPFCPKCKTEPKAAGQGYCAPCKAELMRERRRAGLEPLSEQERAMNKARAYANVYLQRGHIKRGPCEVDGCLEKPRMHHDDFSKPLEIRWLCLKHRIRRGRRGDAPDRAV